MTDGPSDYPPRWAVYTDRRGRRVYGPVGGNRTARRAYARALIFSGLTILTFAALVILKATGHGV